MFYILDVCVCVCVQVRAVGFQCSSPADDWSSSGDGSWDPEDQSAVYGRSRRW